MRQISYSLMGGRLLTAYAGGALQFPPRSREIMKTTYYAKLRTDLSSARCIQYLAPNLATFDRVLPTSTVTADFTYVSIGSILFEGIQSILDGISSWFIKRTYQPSTIRKRRKHGFMRRKRSVGGRRVLKRRILKGRKRVGGS